MPLGDVLSFKSDPRCSPSKSIYLSICDPVLVIIRSPERKLNFWEWTTTSVPNKTFPSNQLNHQKLQTPVLPIINQIIPGQWSLHTHDIHYWLAFWKLLYTIPAWGGDQQQPPPFDLGRQPSTMAHSCTPHIAGWLVEDEKSSSWKWHLHTTFEIRPIGMAWHFVSWKGEFWAPHTCTPLRWPCLQKNKQADYLIVCPSSITT